MAKLIPFLPFPDEPAELDPGGLEVTTAAAPTPAPDAGARAEALDIRRSFIVEAPAGSGKTGLLIQRFLKLLADESVTSPEQVLAITFTTKATAELRERVLGHLEAARQEYERHEEERIDADTGFSLLSLAAAAEVSSGPAASSFTLATGALAHAVLARDRQLDWQLLDHPHRLNIRTIDSVCAEIARTLPILTGAGGRLAPTDQAQPLYREAARRTLLLLGETGHAETGAGADAGSNAIFDAALRDLLLHRDGNLADCETLLADMLAVRDQWGGLIPLAHPHLDDAWLDANTLPRLQAALEQAICAELSRLSETFPASVLQELSELAAELGELDGYRGNPSPIAVCAGRPEPPEAIAEHLAHWRALIHILVTSSGGKWRQGFNNNHLGFESERQHKARMKAVVDRISHRPDLLEALCRVSALPPAQYPANQWRVAKSLFRVLSRALIELQLVFADRGQCDFTELSLLARAALAADSGPEDLAASLGARLQHLLVDEMQDTSAGQYELLRLLTESWDGHGQTVFLVGDPRQSIYLFRQASVESFVRTMQTQRLGELPLTHLRLTANFRSQQTLVEHFNRDFARIFPGSAGESLPYNDAEPVLPRSPHAAALLWHANPVHIHPDVTMRAPQNLPLLGLSPAELRQRQARRDARAIRRIVQAWFARPLPPGRRLLANGQPEPWRIAVLVRSRSHLAEIVAAFDDPRNPVPYRAVDITPLNERQEVLDLTALTRALLHPADRVAALAVLRAPWCGLSLGDLLTLTGSEDEAEVEAEADAGPGAAVRSGAKRREQSIQRLMAERGRLLPEPSMLRLQRVGHVFAEAASRRARLTTAQLVERAWRSLGGDAWLTPPELVNARRFFHLLDALEAEGGIAGRIDPNLLDARLQRLYAEPNSIPPGEAFVELTTIHAAKGLEWDVVVVPALERSPNISRGRLLTWAELTPSAALDPDAEPDASTPAPIMLAPIAAKGEEVDTLTTWLKTLAKEREAAERKRLVYVAATRAREELHLFAAPDISMRGNIALRWDSLLKSAWPAAEFHVTAAHEAAQPVTPSMAQALRDADALSREGASAFPEAAQPFPTAPQPIVLDFATAAAGASPEPDLTPLRRLPASFDPGARFAAARAQRLRYADPESAAIATGFLRPDGSLAARSFGNAVHGLLELLAERLAGGATAAILRGEVAGWGPRIAALLRADGLDPATVARLARETRTALENTLRDSDGVWLLAPHPAAAAELSLTSLTGNATAGYGAPGHGAPGPAATIRVDRSFLGGSAPGAPAVADETFLWIIDYKTADHGASGLGEFLEEQRATYAAQLEGYARVLAPAYAKPLSRVRLALYFPTIPRLVWWTPV